MSEIKLVHPKTGDALSLSGSSYSGSNDIYPLIDGVYRFVDSNNYTASFGYQWNKFEKTQIDRDKSGHAQSFERFAAETNWDLSQLEGKKILEVGSGAGRFSRVVLEHSKAELFSLDYSSAVEANFRNNSTKGNITLFQASIYEMPFAPQQFDKVFCLGVLQHTPDFNKSVQCLTNMVKPGGELVIDFYERRSWWTLIHAKYLLRPFTKKMDHDRLLRLIEKNVTWLISFYKFLYRIKLGILTRFLPICDVYHTLPDNLDDQTLREWVILDTFDMYSPHHDHPQTIQAVRKMVEKAGLKVSFADHVYFSNNQAAVVRAIRD